MTVWEFDVGVTTHELLHAGVLVDQWLNIRVAADSWLDASRTAIQMGMCHGYATECLLRL